MWLPPHDAHQITRCRSLLIVADGTRPDSIANAMRRGIVPALTALVMNARCTRSVGLQSVTGPASAPFLMGRYPGPIGLPGLRWYDSERKTCRLPGNSRSYVGPEMRHIDNDIDPSAPTIFELAGSSVAALNVIGRGLPPQHRIGRGIRFVARTGRTHFSGKVKGWLAIDQEIASEVAEQIRVKNPDFVFSAMTGIDKTSHSEGHGGAYVDRALEIVDDAVAEIRGDAERRGTWESTHLWVVSDHGHSPVREHEDLAGLIRRLGFRTIAHPFVFSPRGEIAVMVSGNAMAHVYLDLKRRTRPWLGDLGERWKPVREVLLARESVDLMILPVSPGACEIHAGDRGQARLEWADNRITYEPVTGDPLAIGPQHGITEDESYDVTFGSDYPDALVQIARLSDSPRSGEIILSAARNWDFRSKYEPIPHESSHGALHRDHMLVPLLMNRAPITTPRRTVDVMPSALKALGITIPPGLDGKSFL